MSKIACDHVLYCENCDRYYSDCCGCPCPQGKKIKVEESFEGLLETNERLSKSLNYALAILRPRYDLPWVVRAVKRIEEIIEGDYV